MSRYKYVKRVSCALLVVVLSYVILSMVGSVIAFRLIYPRHDGADRFTMKYEELDSASYPREEMSFESGSNRLAAYCYRCDEPAGLIVIAAGLGDGASAHLSEIMEFVDSGYEVFCYDATGVGNSEGSGIVGLSQPGVDLRAAMDYIGGDDSLNTLPILLYAHSAGGYGALTCIEDNDRVKAAVVICAFESPVELMHISARDRVGLLADIEYPFMALQNTFLFGEHADIRASECLKNCDIPVLIYEGEQDSLIPESLRLSSFREEIKNPLVRYHTMDAGHTNLWLSDDALRYRESCCEKEEPDLHRANETDDVFIQEVLVFYQSAI